MKKVFVGNLASEASENDVRALFSEYGTVRSLKLNMDIFTGKCRGFGFVEMEGHEARAAIEHLDGKDFMGKSLRVNEERASPRGRRRGGR